MSIQALEEVEQVVSSKAEMRPEVLETLKSTVADLVAGSKMPQRNPAEVQFLNDTELDGLMNLEQMIGKKNFGGSVPLVLRALYSNFTKQAYSIKIPLDEILNNPEFMQVVKEVSSSLYFVGDQDFIYIVNSEDVEGGAPTANASAIGGNLTTVFPDGIQSAA